MIARYALPAMQAIWNEENKFRLWLDIEIYACEAWAALGVIPEADLALIKEKAAFDLERIEQIEEETNHDVVAFTRAVAESLGPESKWIHYGLTSTDVVDTALSALLVQALDLIATELSRLREALAEQAMKHKYTIMMGRTHGVHAEPTTFGLKMALYVAEMERQEERLKKARANMAYGKLSGAVGTYANIDPRVEAHVCKRLGLTPAPIATQTLQRDRHAEVLTTLANIAGSLEKLALEFRNLQRTEVREVEESFRGGQKGSSAMPHKRNPILSERISGLARLMRGYAIAALEDMALWHERDISHSSVERIILPDATQLLYYMLRLLRRVVTDLQIYPRRMEENLSLTRGLIFSQPVLLMLVEKGLSREQAYDLVQRHAMDAWQQEKEFFDLLAEDPEIRALLTKDELSSCFDPRRHLVAVEEIFFRLGLVK